MRGKTVRGERARLLQCCVQENDKTEQHKYQDGKKNKQRFYVFAFCLQRNFSACSIHQPFILPTPTNQHPPANHHRSPTVTHDHHPSIHHQSSINGHQITSTLNYVPPIGQSGKNINQNRLRCVNTGGHMGIVPTMGSHYNISPPHNTKHASPSSSPRGRS